MLNLMVLFFFFLPEKQNFLGSYDNKVTNKRMA